MAVPVKPFGVAKARLGPRWDAAVRARLGRAVAAHTVAAAADAGADPLVVTGDDGVARWARRRGFVVLREDGPGLDGAAATAVRAAAGRAWVFVHADLPLITPADVALVLDELASGATVLAPSTDGGTNVLGGHTSSFPFSYGPGSFRRHLRHGAVSGPVAVVVRVALALDLDRPADLMAALAHPSGAWLAPLVGDHGGARRRPLES